MSDKPASETPRTAALRDRDYNASDLVSMDALLVEILESHEEIERALQSAEQRAERLEGELQKQARYIGCVWCGDNIYEYTGPLKVSDKDAKLILQASHEHDASCSKNPLVSKLAQERAARERAETDVAKGLAALRYMNASCRPAVKHYRDMLDRQVLQCENGTLPAHYRETLAKEANRYSILLNEIDAAINEALAQEWGKP